MITPKQILNIASYAGEIILKNGGEIYRTEDTITRICNAYGFEYVDSLVTPTGIFVSIDDGDEISKTQVRRIHRRQINLTKISKTNNFSRELEQTTLNYKEALSKLKAIDNSVEKSRLKLGILGISLGVSTNVIIMHADYINMLPAFLASLSALTINRKIGFLKDVNFIPEIIGGFIAGIISLLCYKHNLGNNLGIIIVSAILPFVPGVALTNSIRDAINGDLISATSRGVEAILIASCLALGVGIALEVLHLQ